MSRGRLVVHGHFYQPLRVDPFSGTVPADPSAAPFENWNARVAAECYRPNAERRNYGRMSWDLGPTLAEWLETGDPKAYRGFIDGDRPGDRDASIPVSRGNGMAQPYHHAIAALASAADRRTEIRWGMRDFLLRFGRDAEGLWFPETAVDIASLRIAAEEGIRYTVLAPWQAAMANLDTRRPYRVELGGGRSIVVVFYDAGLSAAVSFEPEATADADRFARERIAPRLGGSSDASGAPPLVVIATDGELYGHHQAFRELFLQRLIRPGADQPDHGFDVVDLASALVPDPTAPFRTVRINERTSWSCHHGVLRWSGECGCVTDGHWKAPLRAGVRTARGGDRCGHGGAVRRAAGRARPVGSPGRLHRRRPRRRAQQLVRCPAGRQQGAGRGSPHAAAADGRAALATGDVLERRLVLGRPDAPGDPPGVALRGRAAQLADEIAGTDLERRLIEDLALLRSPRNGTDGAAIYRLALQEVGHAAPDAAITEGQASA